MAEFKTWITTIERNASQTLKKLYFAYLYLLGQIINIYLITSILVMNTFTKYWSANAKPFSE